MRWARLPTMLCVPITSTLEQERRYRWHFSTSRNREYCHGLSWSICMCCPCTSPVIPTWFWRYAGKRYPSCKTRTDNQIRKKKTGHTLGRHKTGSVQAREATLEGKEHKSQSGSYGSCSALSPSSDQVGNGVPFVDELCDAAMRHLKTRTAYLQPRCLASGRR